MDIEVGDVIETPAGDASVISVDLAREIILVAYASGLASTWPLSCLELPGQPDMDDQADLERWLRIKAVAVPHVRGKTQTMPCACTCGLCYYVERRDGPNSSWQHFRNAAACTCELGRCECVVMT